MTELDLFILNDLSGSTRSKTKCVQVKLFKFDTNLNTTRPDMTYYPARIAMANCQSNKMPYHNFRNQMGTYSNGRALALHARDTGFYPVHLHMSFSCSIMDLFCDHSVFYTLFKR